mmetsp:Transcript_8902/g.31318  ORF Transcript_8902/g.31318 Transcript_8902/m.31318 type:complete len:204 (+) Transcript_8902:263-874(+)
MLPEDVGLLLAVELTLPLFEAEARVVLHAGHEHVAAGDGVVDGQPHGGAHGVGERGEYRALHDDGPEARVGRDHFQRLGDDAWLHLFNVQLCSQLDCLKAVDVLAADDDKRRVAHVLLALGLQRFKHAVQVAAVCREDCDLLARREAGSHSRQLHQRRHKHGELGPRPNQRLQLHHEIAVAGNAAAALCHKPLDGGLELHQDL